MTPTPLTRNTRIRRRADVLGRALGDQMVMLDVKQGKYFGLDDVGRALWDRLETPVSLGSLCQSLGEAYEVDPQTCERDIKALLGQLLEAGLVEIQPDPCASAAP